MSLKTRLKSLEGKHLQQGTGESDRDAWLPAFKEFGLSPDTPIPDHMPIIRCIFSGDGKDTGRRLLRLNGDRIERQVGA